MRRIALVAIVATMLGGVPAPADAAVVDSNEDVVTASVDNGTVESGPGGGSDCSWRPATQGELSSLYSGQEGYEPSDSSDPVLIVDGGVTQQLFVRTCDEFAEFVLVTITDPPTLRARAFDDVSARVPVPTVLVEPRRAAGWVLVQTPLDFRTDASTWAPVEATASASGEWVTVRAEPVRLTFDPGQPRVSTFWGPNDPAVSCDGDAPIAEFVLEAPGECVYTYYNASSTAPDGENFEASLAIEWRVTYWSSDPGFSGTLALAPTVTAFDLQVAEAKALIVCSPAEYRLYGGCDDLGQYDQGGG